MATNDDKDHPLCQHDPGTTKIAHGGKRITRIPACMKKYKNLKELWLTGTKVSRIQNLDKNVNLEYLGLGGTDVRKIENLEKNVKLDSLDLSGTPVSKIENLGKNVNLDFLDLSGTNVPDEEKRAFEASRPGLDVY